LGTTAQNVNGLIISSTQGAAAAMTDAFFGATKSIEEFFSNMVKNIVQMIVEQLLVKGILALLGSFIPGLGAVGAVAGAGAGAGAGAVASVTSASRNIPTENLGSRTISITVNGSTSESTVAERRATMRRIEKAVFTERFA
jgi:uncharacterized membrane protein